MPEFTKPDGNKPPITGQGLMSNPDLASFLKGAGVPVPPPAAFGAVSPPPSTLPQTATPPPPAPVAAAPDAPPAPELEAAPEAPADPKEKYLAKLKEMNVSKEQAAQIIDAMIMNGLYEEEVAVTKKLRVKFRTRGQDAADRLNKALNDENPQFTGSVYSLIAKYNLAASLVQYGPHKFDPSTEDGFKHTMEYIRTKIPQPVYTVLVTKLSKFDEKLAAVMTEGAVEDFF